MIQFNLLPDVKLKYIKAAQMKRTTMVVSALIAASALAVFIMLFLAVQVFQKNHLKDLTNDINTNKTTLENKKDLNKVLTIQNQLGSLQGLHDEKPVTSRLFGYLGQITPAAVNIGDMSLDFATNAISLKGTTDSISTVNKFVDTIKFTTYTIDGKSPGEDSKTFKNVVMASYSITEKNGVRIAGYTITFNFNPVIFNNNSKVALDVPKIISTRSETEKPTELFKALPEPEKKEQ